MQPSNSRFATAQQHHAAFRPTTYSGDGMEVLANLDIGNLDVERISHVASWHEAPFRRGGRHAVIAKRLRNMIAG